VPRRKTVPRAGTPEWTAQYAADEARREADRMPITKDQERAVAELLKDDPFNAIAARRILAKRRKKT